MWWRAAPAAAASATPNLKRWAGWVGSGLAPARLLRFSSELECIPRCLRYVTWPAHNICCSAHATSSLAGHARLAQVRPQGEWSAKVEALLRRLLHLAATAPAEKSLVFSQFPDALKVRQARRQASKGLGWLCGRSGNCIAESFPLLSAARSADGCDGPANQRHPLRAAPRGQAGGEAAARTPARGGATTALASRTPS